MFFENIFQKRNIRGARKHNGHDDAISGKHGVLIIKRFESVDFIYSSGQITCEPDQQEPAPEFFGQPVDLMKIKIEGHER